MAEEINRRHFCKTSCLTATGIVCLNGISFSLPPLPDEKLWKWSKESMFAEVTSRGIKCLICPNECILKSGDTSFCRSRINYKEKMYSIAYGNPCAVHIDPIEKKPFFHFMPGARAFSLAAAGCNFSCLNCQNWSISQASPRDTKNYDLMPAAVVQKCIENNSKVIAYTYSEPVTFYEYVHDTAIIAKQNGIRNVIVSNGYINETPLRRLCKVIDGATIDLKSFDDQTYIRLNAGGLQPVLKSLQIFREEGVWLEISNLIIPEWSDQMDMIRKMCDWLYDKGFDDTPLHFLRFQPMYKLNRLSPTPVPVLQQAAEIAKKAGLKYVYIGNIPGSDPVSTYCPSCKRKIIERNGITVLSNHLNKGKCSFCSAIIAGIWN